MITPSDYVCLPYTPDLTEAGISYACRSLPHTYDRVGGSPFGRLRRIVVGIAVELAFRRYLTQQAVPFDIRGSTPFTDPDRYDVSLAGHRCDIKSFLLSYREQIRSVHSNPAQLLQAPGLVPLDQYAAEGHAQSDAYLFAFVTGLVASSPVDVDRARAAGRPVYLMHALPPAWVRPAVWTPLGPLALKSDGGQPLRLELGGQDADREFTIQSVELLPRRRVEVEGDFYSLASIRSDSLLEGRLGIHSPSRQETYVIPPAEWGNIWIYGMRIYLPGWITRGEFRQRAALVREGSRVFQYDRTRIRNLAVPIADLKPLSELFERSIARAHSHTNGAAGSLDS